MVYRTVTWHCDSCRKTFSSYEAAHSCETGHIVQESIDRTQEAIKAAFDKSPQIRARLKEAKP